MTFYHKTTDENVQGWRGFSDPSHAVKYFLLRQCLPVVDKDFTELAAVDDVTVYNIITLCRERERDICTVLLSTIISELTIEFNYSVKFNDVVPMFDTRRLGCQ